MMCLIFVISVWFIFELLAYDIRRYYRKYKLDKIINNAYNVGVKLCQKLIEAKSEN